MFKPVQRGRTVRSRALIDEAPLGKNKIKVRKRGKLGCKATGGEESVLMEKGQRGGVMEGSGVLRCGD